MNRGLIALFVVPVVAAAALPLKAQVITSIERRNPNVASAAAFVRIAPGPLVERATAYADRTHLYRNVPPALVGAQYIIMAMEDKDNPNLELHLKIGQPGTLYLILDNRVGTNLRSPTATPTPLMAGMAWVTVMGFADTGLDMAVDELADGTIDNYYSVFSIPVAPGEVILRAQKRPIVRAIGTCMAWPLRPLSGRQAIPHRPTGSRWWSSPSWRGPREQWRLCTMCIWALPRGSARRTLSVPSCTPPSSTAPRS